MSKPIIDRAEVAIEFPDKFYHGSFGRGSRFDVKPESEGLVITLDRQGDEKRHVEFHVHYYLLEDLISAIADALEQDKAIPEQNLNGIKTAGAKLASLLD